MEEPVPEIAATEAVVVGDTTATEVGGKKRSSAKKNDQEDLAKKDRKLALELYRQLQATERAGRSRRSCASAPVSYNETELATKPRSKSSKGKGKGKGGKGGRKSWESDAGSGKARAGGGNARDEESAMTSGEYVEVDKKWGIASSIATHKRLRMTEDVHLVSGEYIIYVVRLVVSPL